LKATRIVRKDCVKEKTSLDSRGTYIIKYDKASDMNLITLMDSKVVSLLSTAAGSEPKKKCRAILKRKKGKGKN